jgi:dolichyl-phosphate beta-glucosyltransferase
MTQLQLSVVIPAYNEQSRLPRYLDEIASYLNAGHVDYEIVVVDDGSSDATAQMVETLREHDSRLRLIRFPANRGKGAAVRAGMLSASGRLRLFTDADGATPIAELARLESAIAAGAEVAAASRAFPGPSTQVTATMHRKIIGTMFNRMVRVLAVPGIRDTQCGFKLFTERAANRTFALQTIDGFGFDVEVLYLARKHHLRIEEVPVNWTDVSGSKVRLVRDSFRMLCDILAIRWNDVRCRYRLEDVSRQTP